MKKRLWLVGVLGVGIAARAWWKNRARPGHDGVEGKRAEYLSLREARERDGAEEGEVVPIHDWIYHAMFGLYGVYFKLGRWKIHGRENVPMSGPVIIAPNHKSLLDPPLVGSSMPRLVTTMGKIELFEKKHFGLPILGKVIQHMGTFPVRRNTPDRRAIKRALKVLRGGGALAIFPEGTRTRDGELGPPETGIALIAHKAKAPVVPAYLKGTEGCFSYMQPRARLVQCEIFYGKPVYFEEEYARRGDRATLEAIANRIMDEIVRLKKEAGD